ncbi:MAG: extracellular solute-binding protein, partial [Methylococcales bacterium]|nr:extracellular solute-binding protein [Methylococcales bacterium]
EMIEPELAGTFRFLLEHGRAASNTLEESVAQGALNDAFTAILDDGEAVATALARAQSTAESTLQTTLAAQSAFQPEAEIVVVPLVASAPPIADDAVAIVYAPIGGPVQREALDDLAQVFMETHPNIVINLEPSEFSSSNTMSHVAATSSCFEWGWPFDRVEAENAVLSLEPFMDADPTIQAEDFFPALIAQFSVEGQLLGLPGVTSIDVIGYNKDIFDAAGVPYPTDDWTTEEFVEKAVALTAGAGTEKIYGYLPHQFEGLDFYSWVMWLTPSLIDDSVDPPRLRLDDSQTIDAVRWHTSLTTEHQIKPIFVDTFTDLTTEKDWRALKREGQAAMWLQASLINAPERRRETADSTGYVTIPVAPDGSHYSSGGGFQVARGYFISASTEPEAAQACWQWMTFITQEFYGAGDIGVVPARRTVAEADAYGQAVGSERAAVNIKFVDSLPALTTHEYTWWDPFIGLYFLDEAYKQLIFDNVPVESVLSEAQAKADSYRNCVIDRDAFTDAEGQQACMSEILPSP